MKHQGRLSYYFLPLAPAPFTVVTLIILTAKKRSPKKEKEKKKTQARQK